MLAGAMIMLVGMAAVAIDLGAGFNERRQDQIGADGSALSGAVSIIGGQALPTVVADIKTNAVTNVGRPLDWATCQDPDSLGGLTAAQTTAFGLDAAQPCISFGQNTDGVAFGRIRVRIPDQTTDTSFGQVIGSPVLTTHAAAEVEIGGSGPYRTFPSMVFSPANPGDEFCVRSSPGAATPSPSEDCEGSATGNFGLFQPYFYTNVGGWFCSSGNSAQQSAYAIAVGLDHTLAPNPLLANPQILNGSDCPQSGGPLNPNQISFTSGNDPNITDGLIEGSNGGGPPFPVAFDGRLNQQDWGAAYGSAAVFSYTLDNRPLWTYIDPAVAPVGACADAAGGPATATAVVDPVFDQAKADLVACLGSGPPDNLFLTDIYDSPRLTTVPKLLQAAPCGNASCIYDITDIVPVFIQSVYTDVLATCNGTMVNDGVNGFCRHDPGRTGSITDFAPGQRQLKSTTGIVLTCDMLPPPGAGDQKCQNIGGAGGPTTFLSSSLVK